MDMGVAGVARVPRAVGRRAVWARLGGLALAAGLWPAAAGRAGAEAEWCDDGSPPPNDFRLQPTGTGSATSEPAWLKSTDDGGSLLAAYAATGQVDVSQVGQLSGGVAEGMSTAGEARSDATARR
jgi:hypothetical protein